MKRDRASTTLRAGLPLLPALLALVAMLAILPSDPAPGMTDSSSPYTDEAYNVVNARNEVLLGRWSTDDWNLHLVNGPFSPAVAGVYRLFGVGIEPARLFVTLLSCLAIALVALVSAASFGTLAGVLAGIALGGNTLMLYYGRLAYLEPMVLLFLLAGTTLLIARPPIAGWRLGAAGGLLLGMGIATKPSAAFAAIGILAGVSLAGGIRRRATWEPVGAALAGMVAVGIGWLLLIGLPNWPAVQADLRIWAAEPPPENVGQALQRMAAYLTVNDGAIGFAFTLAIAAAAGAVVAVRRWRFLEPAHRAVVGAAVGWLVAGMGLLLIVPYRPNRYVVPMLPALALLAAVGVEHLLQAVASLRGGRAVAVIALSAGLALPGASAYAGWAATQTHRLTEAQALVEQHVGPGEAVQGELAPLFALRVPVITYISRPADGINPGNLYASGHVRWLVQRPHSAPAWWPQERPAWRAQETAGCVDWGGFERCLVHIPDR
ncbi:MAG TPA: glycosyltransferase family 39 protein [Candidatus Limnocylindria bacterium]